jgi:oligosaccharide repeat unit polymerase
VEAALVYSAILGLHLAGWWAVMAQGRFLRRPLPAVFYLVMLVFNGFGSLYVVWPELSQIRHLSPEIGNTYLLLVVLQILVFYVFLLLSGRYLRTASPASDRNRGTLVGRVSVIFWALSLIMVGAYVAREGIPYGLTINPVDFAKQEIISLRTSAVQIQLGVLIVGFYGFPVLGAVGSLLYWRARPSSTARRLFLLLSLASAVLLSLAFLHKTPVVALLSALLLAYLLQRQRIAWRLLLSTISIVVVVILALYFLYNPDHELQRYLTSLLPGIVRRIMGSYSESLAAVIDVVHRRGFFGGTTLSHPGIHLPYQPVDLPGVLHEEIIGRPGNAPVGVAGEGYANFGWPGAVLFLVLANAYVFLAQGLIDWLGRNDRSLWSFGAVFFALIIYQLPTSSISLTILDPVNLLSLLVILATVRRRIARAPGIDAAPADRLADKAAQRGPAP